MLGASVLPVAFILKLTPKEWVDKIPELVNEDERNQLADNYVGKFEQANERFKIGNKT